VILGVFTDAERSELPVRKIPLVKKIKK